MHAFKVALGAALLAICAAAASSPDASTDSASYGLDPSDPVEVCEPTGQREYLSRLVCPSGAHPEFSRAGSIGPRTPLPSDFSRAAAVQLAEDMLAKKPLAAGAVDYHFIDAYEVTCASETTTIYMDMYHCTSDVPTIAPDGFGILH